MLNITHYQRNANQNHNDVPSITRQSEWLLSKSLQAINVGEGVAKKEPSYTVGGNVNWYRHLKTKKRVTWLPVRKYFMEKIEYQLFSQNGEEKKM